MKRPLCTILTAALLTAGAPAFAAVTLTVREAGTGNATINITPGASFSVDVLVSESNEGTGISGVQFNLDATGPAAGALLVVGPADTGGNSAAINAAEWDAVLAATALNMVSGPLDIGPFGAGYSASSVLDGNTTPSSRIATIQLKAADNAASGTYQVSADGLAFPDFQGSNIADISTTSGGPLAVVVGSVQICSRTVAGRSIYYKGSSWGSTPAPDKQPLLPGQKGTFANYISYSRGINGIYVDIAPGQNCAALNVTASDFLFKVGNSNSPDAWATAPAPSSVTVLAGQGVGGSDRVVINWPDSPNTGSIANSSWVQVTVLANANTGLTAADVHYWGLAIGDTGNSATDAQVNATDLSLVSADPHGLTNPATITNAHDFNRDKQVNATDLTIANGHGTGLTTALKLITVP